MGFLKRFGAGVLAGVAGAVYVRSMLARNRRLQRPPVRDIDGQPIPVGTFTYSDGEVVEYVDVGEGLPLVWVPGADGPKETWRYQLPQFALSYRVLASDLRVTIAPDHDFNRFAEDLIEFLDARGIEKCVLIGQSLGTAIAIRFTTLFPDRVLGLVLANPVPRVSYEHLGLNRSGLIPLAQVATRYLPTGLSRAIARAAWSPLGVWIYDGSAGTQSLIEYAHNTGPRTTPARVSAARVGLLKGHDLIDELWSIQAPTLVVKGPLDVYCPVSWALEIADGLPDARYVPIPGTGHCSHISRPGAFNQAVETWLDEVIRPRNGRIQIGDAVDARDGGDG